MSLFITKETYHAICSFLSDKATENGGVILADKNGVISKFICDNSPFESTELSYCPNVDILNKRINEAKNEENLSFAGFVHSHLNNFVLSKEDEAYLREIIYSLNLKSIICGIYDVSEAKLQWYVIQKLTAQYI